MIFLSGFIDLILIDIFQDLHDSLLTYFFCILEFILCALSLVQKRIGGQAIFISLSCTPAIFHQ